MWGRQGGLFRASGAPQYFPRKNMANEDFAKMIAEIVIPNQRRIATGTPPGVGFARKPPVYLKAGDVCEVEIDGLGVLRNTVAAFTD